MNNLILFSISIRCENAFSKRMSKCEILLTMMFIRKEYDLERFLEHIFRFHHFPLM